MKAAWFGETGGAARAGAGYNASGNKADYFTSFGRSI
jgi:hypothetical protein